ncbi:AsnC family transcriptional regulator [Sphingomonas panacis]|uniref:AsnC family transcriptional regulator n=1 Tax=Sphingomonas panacis TaxID=1560345 RepID=A0A1B3Z6X9_9SPHN|nr:Lrp/AsnC family transcriptional regulator [Sphingomonas panacis]AOH83180.1 AsnC family transcriptional regulator [Sphingomonas panacis]
MKRSYNLDDIDRRILCALQADAGIGNGDLAERVGSSTASVWRRIKAMEAGGLLKQSVRLLDQQALGFGVNVLCNIRVRSHAREVRDAFETFVEGRPEILECFSMSGDWDYLLRIVAADVTGYERFLMNTLLEHPSVGGASSHFALSLTKYTTALPLP